MTLDGSLSQREEISWPKMGILKWPLTKIKSFKSLIVSFSIVFLKIIYGALHWEIKVIYINSIYFNSFPFTFDEISRIELISPASSLLRAPCRADILGTSAIQGLRHGGSAPYINHFFKFISCLVLYR